MAQIVATLERSGADAEQIRDFVAQGMLLNVMLAMRAPEHLDDGGPLGRLTSCAFGAALKMVDRPASHPPQRSGREQHP